MKASKGFANANNSLKLLPYKRMLL